MNAEATRAEFSVVKGSELSLSGPALVQVLRAVLEKGAPVRFRAKGFSMTPFIKNGDVITLRPVQKTTPGLGDVIAFLSPETETVCVHRVVGKKGDSLLTKGDNLREPDESVRRQSVLGVVTRVERAGKEVFLGLGPWRFLIAFLSRRGMLLSFLFPLWRRIRPIINGS